MKARKIFQLQVSMDGLAYPENRILDVLQNLLWEIRSRGANQANLDGMIRDGAGEIIIEWKVIEEKNNG